MKLGNDGQLSIHLIFTVYAIDTRYRYNYSYIFWTLFRGFEMNSQAQEEPSTSPAEVKT